MATTHSAAVRATLAGAIKTAAEDGGNPRLKVYAADDTLLVDFPITFGAVSAAAIAVQSTPVSATAEAGIGTKTATKYSVTTAAGAEIYSGTAGAAGDIVVSPADITAEQTVQLTSHSYTAPV